jgi:hypothetical protein
MSIRSFRVATLFSEGVVANRTRHFNAGDTLAVTFCVMLFYPLLGVKAIAAGRTLHANYKSVRIEKRTGLRLYFRPSGG